MISCLDATLVALRIALAMGHDDATASQAALGTWEHCAEVQQIGVAELDSADEAELLARATSPDLGYSVALEGSRACGTTTAWVERVGGIWWGVCGDEDGEPLWGAP